MHGPSAGQRSGAVLIISLIQRLLVLTGAPSSPSAGPALWGNSYIKGLAWGSQELWVREVDWPQLSFHSWEVSGWERSPKITGGRRAGVKKTLFCARCYLAAQRGEGVRDRPADSTVLQFARTYVYSILSPPLPWSPICPSRTSLFRVQLMDWLCFWWGFQKQFLCTSHLCATAPQVPGALILSCSAVTLTTVTWLPMTQTLPISLREEWPQMHEMWLLPPRGEEKTYMNKTPRGKSLTRYN